MFFPFFGLNKKLQPFKPNKLYLVFKKTFPFHQIHSLIVAAVLNSNACLHREA